MKPYVFNNGNDAIFKLEVKSNFTLTLFYTKKNLNEKQDLAQSEQSDFGEKGNYTLLLCHLKKFCAML